MEQVYSLVNFYAPPPGRLCAAQHMERDIMFSHFSVCAAVPASVPCQHQFASRASRDGHSPARYPCRQVNFCAYMDLPAVWRVHSLEKKWNSPHSVLFPFIQMLPRCHRAVSEGHLVSEVTYNVSSGTLNRTILYHARCHQMTASAVQFRCFGLMRQTKESLTLTRQGVYAMARTLACQ